MKLVIITQYHPPEMGAAATRWSDYANILSNLGHAVTVLCEIPNYPAGVIPVPYRNCKIVVEKSTHGNYQIIRIPVWVNQRNTSLKRLGFYLSFMLSSMMTGLKLKGYDAIIVSSPPLFVGITGIFLKKIRGIPLLLDIRDLWPESAIVLGELKGKLLIGMAKFIERSLYRNTAHFLLAVPGFADYLQTHDEIPSGSLILPLLNGVSKRFLHHVKKTKSGDSDHFTVVYAGNIGLAQDLKTIIKVAGHLSDLNLIFNIIGQGVQKEMIVNLAAELNLHNLRFIDPLNKRDLIYQVKSADISLVPLIKSPLFRHALPSKLFEMMACGTPPVVGVKGDIEAVVEQAKCGVCVEPGDERAYETAIRNYVNNPERLRIESANGKRYIEENMVKEQIAKSTFDRVFKAL